MPFAHDKEAIMAKFVELSMEDLEYVLSDFDDLDADGSGTLDFDEVKAYVAADGGVSEEEAAGLMKQYDLDNDGKVSVEEYLQVMGFKLKK